MAKRIDWEGQDYGFQRVSILEQQYWRLFCPAFSNTRGVTSPVFTVFALSGCRIGEGFAFWRFLTRGFLLDRMFILFLFFSGTVGVL